MTSRIAKQGLANHTIYYLEIVHSNDNQGYNGSPKRYTYHSEREFEKALRYHTKWTDKQNQSYQEYFKRSGEDFGTITIECFSLTGRPVRIV